ncbi:MAG: DNA-directed RNA polymerase subunit P, partial [Methanoregulaceae archaeon]|nr:DNA-directed RNA polymerase subunit P [Methanoregulaceae archaeon]
KQKVEIDVNVRCPYCGHRILFKERGAAIKELKAR